MPFDSAGFSYYEPDQRIQRLQAELEVLRKAYAAVRDPKQWTTYRLCRRSLFGAYRACAVGHLAIAAGYPPHELFGQSCLPRVDPVSWPLVDRICSRNYNSGNAIAALMQLNDKGEHALVVAWFERAIGHTEYLIHELDYAL